MRRLAAALLPIAAIADRRPVAPLRNEASALNIPIKLGVGITTTKGHLRVTDARFSDGDWIACDAIAMSGGWTPTVHLFSQSRGTLFHDPETGVFLPDRSPANVRVAGACAGVFGLAACLESGYATGTPPSTRTTVAVPAEGAPSGPPIVAEPAKWAFVDFQNDTTTNDLQIATDEGFRSVEHLKRYTTTGMATDQGKTSGENALAVAAAAMSSTPSGVGLTTFRVPWSPVTFGTLAGPSRDVLYEPARHTPSDEWASRHGAMSPEAVERMYWRPSNRLHGPTASPVPAAVFRVWRIAKPSARRSRSCAICCTTRVSRERVSGSMSTSPPLSPASPAASAAGRPGRSTPPSPKH